MRARRQYRPAGPAGCTGPRYPGKAVARYCVIPVPRPVPPSSGPLRRHRAPISGTCSHGEAGACCGTQDSIETMMGANQNNPDTSQVRTSFGAASAIVGSKTLLVAATAWLPFAANTGEERLGILAFANLLNALLLLHPRCRAIPSGAGRGMVHGAIVVWSVSYALTYGAFVFGIAGLSGAQIIVAHTAAPLVAALLTGEVSFARSGFGRVALRMSPLVLLAAIAATQLATARELGLGATASLLSVCGFVGTQWAIRVVAMNGATLAGPPRVGLLSGTLLVLALAWGPTEGRTLPNPSTELFLSAILLSAMGLGAQFLTLYGLRRARAETSVLLLSLSVPMAVLLSAVVDRRDSLAVEISLSALYVCVTYIVVRNEERQ